MLISSQLTAFGWPHHFFLRMVFAAWAALLTLLKCITALCANSRRTHSDTEVFALVHRRMCLPSAHSQNKQGIRIHCQRPHSQVKTKGKETASKSGKRAKRRPAQYTTMIILQRWYGKSRKRHGNTLLRVVGRPLDLARCNRSSRASGVIQQEATSANDSLNARVLVHFPHHHDHRRRPISSAVLS